MEFSAIIVVVIIASACVAFQMIYHDRANEIMKKVGGRVNLNWIDIDELKIAYSLFKNGKDLSTDELKFIRRYYLVLALVFVLYIIFIFMLIFLDW